ncbi:MAG: hypothetical protein PsegKO_29900 [Pseudohongiellaceae bacterium]
MIASLFKKGLIATVLILLPLLALAHTGLKSSSPADGAMLNAAPASVDLQFNAAVRLIRIEITSNGKTVDTGFKPASEAMASYSIATPGLMDGNYTVDWAAISADGHTVTNSFSFTVDSSVAASGSR